MKYSRLSIIRICILIGAIFILGFQLKPAFDIPKTWDLAEIEQFLLPTADSTITVTPISESYYYSIPEMKVYKSYPIRLTGLEENRKYIDSLKANVIDLRVLGLNLAAFICLRTPDPWKGSTFSVSENSTFFSNKR